MPRQYGGGGSRFNWVSPGAAAVESFTESLDTAMKDRELKARQARQDAMEQARIEREVENARIQREILMEDQKFQREDRALNQRLGEVQRAGYMAGDIIKPEHADLVAHDAQQTLPGKFTTGIASGLPTATQTPPPGQTAAPVPEGTTAAPDVRRGAPATVQQTATGNLTARGTPQERAAAQKKATENAAFGKFLKDNPSLMKDPVIKGMVEYAQITGETGGLMGAIAARTKPVTQELEVRSAGGDLFERQPNGQWMKVASGSSGEGGGKGSYHHMVTLDDGVYMVDSTNPAIRTRIGNPKLGETAQAAVANADTIMWTIDRVIERFDPAKIGPAMGRYKTMEAAFTGGDPEFAAMAAQVAALKNTVINLRTGAAMSVDEANRILQEIADVNLPPATFMARLTNAQNYFKEWKKNRLKVSGNRNPEVVGAGAGGGGGRATGAGPAGGPAAPGAAPEPAAETPAQKRDRLLKAGIKMP